MLRPIFAQPFAPLRHSAVGPLLLAALRWWQEVLTADMTVTLNLYKITLPVVHLFCDAEGSPPRIAGILVRDGRLCSYSCFLPDNALRSARDVAFGCLYRLHVSSLLQGAAAPQ